jgi:hypothetical protein
MTREGCRNSRGQKKKKTVTCREGRRRFQEVKVPRIHENGTGWW